MHLFLFKRTEVIYGYPREAEKLEQVMFPLFFNHVVLGLYTVPPYGTFKWALATLSAKA